MRKGVDVLRVGLTGGLASGKSFVGDTLAALGCSLLKADEVGHRLLEPDGAAYPLVVAAFGEQVLDLEDPRDANRISRPKLAAMVFGHPDRLAQLNAIVHPLVFDEEERFFKELASKEVSIVERGDNPKAARIGIVEAAILIETGNYQSFDKIVVAWCSREVQIRRAIHRGLTREEALARLDHQMSLDDKLAYAHEVVDTSGSKEETRALVEALYGRLLEELV